MEKILKFFSILLLFTTITAQSQTTEQRLSMHAISQNKDGKTLIRFAPASSELWRLGNIYGYSIVREEFSFSNAIIPVPEKNLLTTQAIVPVAKDVWEKLFDINDYFKLMAQMLFGDSLDISLNGDPLFAASNLRELEDNRFAMAMLCADRDFDVANYAGLAWIDSTTHPNTTYIYRVFPNLPDSLNFADTAVVFVNPNDRAIFVPINDIATEVQNQNVTLILGTSEFGNIYNSYIVERRKSGSKNFERILTNVVGNVNFERNKVIFTDILPDYGVKYEYRVCAVDVFGTKSPYSEIVKVSAIKKHDVAPQNFIISEENPLKFVWEFDPSLSGSIKEFLLCYQQKIDSKIDTLLRISKNARTFSASKFSEQVGYYKIAVRYVDGDIQYSNFVFHQAIDSIPPAKVTGLFGKSDTNGIVKLVWTMNKDRDFAGYRIFKANDTNSDFIRVNVLPILDSFFIDTIAKNALSSTYYRVQVIDNRGNESGFSEILKVLAPKAAKPTPPQFVKYDVSSENIELVWAKSSNGIGKTVILYKLTDGKYTEIKREQSDSIRYNAVIAWGNGEKEITLALRSMSEEGVFSDFSEKLMLRNANPLKKPLLKAVVDRVYKEIVLSWEKPDKDVVRVQIFKMKTGERPDIAAVLDGAKSTYSDKELEINTNYQYFVKIIDKNGKHSPLSNVVEVKY
ncbi:hypothetical protein FACS1894178_2640 [Bacteroidia bacterium]|nr:hypothetical protein FACS1894178_2640 [Bacteroidia bacterium]